MENLTCCYAPQNANNATTPRAKMTLFFVLSRGKNARCVRYFCFLKRLWVLLIILVAAYGNLSRLGEKMEDTACVRAREADTLIVECITFMSSP